MTRTVFTLAAEMFAAFETGTRTNGDSFVKLSEGSPEWMADVCLAAHDNGNFFPDDWRYDAIKEACGFICDREGNDPEDFASEFADQVDVYNAGLLAWAASNLNRMSYVDEAMEEQRPDTLAQALMMGQANERREVFEAVFSTLEGLADDE